METVVVGGATEPAAKGSGRKPWGAYNIIEREGLEKPIWSRVGSAFRNQDGSFNVYLDSFPLAGRLHIREERERPELTRRGSLGRAADAAEV